MCATSSEHRFRGLAAEAVSLRARDGARLGKLTWSRELADGVACSVWVIGKYDLRVRDHMPWGATAVVFSVPCPLTPGEGGHDSALLAVCSSATRRFRLLGREDVAVVDGGLLQLDLASCSPRGFGVLLPEGQVYACHAAAMVHYHKGWRHHEVGEVDLDAMPRVLLAATELGMSLPKIDAQPRTGQRGVREAASAWTLPAGIRPPSPGAHAAMHPHHGTSNPPAGVPPRAGGGRGRGRGGE